MLQTNSSTSATALSSRVLMSSRTSGKISYTPLVKWVVIAVLAFAVLSWILHRLIPILIVVGIAVFVFAWISGRRGTADERRTESTGTSKADDFDRRMQELDALEAKVSAEVEVE